MSTPQTTNGSGSCLCGAVRFEVNGALRPVMYCHCEQCRKTSGHYVAATACELDDLSFTNDAGLEWYQSSPEAQRGFCKVCGSSLFWKPKNKKTISVMAGSLSRPTGLIASSHIYMHMASDYYEVSDGLPQYDDVYPSDHVDEAE